MFMHYRHETLVLFQNIYYKNLCTSQRVMFISPFAAQSNILKHTAEGTAVKVEQMEHKKHEFQYTQIFILYNHFHCLIS